MRRSFVVFALLSLSVVAFAPSSVLGQEGSGEIIIKGGSELANQHKMKTRTRTNIRPRPRPKPDPAATASRIMAGR
jgi:hypothetical protein